MSRLCKCCGKPLNESQYARNRALKSCPKCSAEDGEEHIFYPYPESFGKSEKRVSSNIRDGAQSWCTLCRGDVAGPHYGGKRCSEIK